MVKPPVPSFNDGISDTEKIRILYDYIYELSDVIDFLLDKHTLQNKVGSDN